MRMSRRRKKSDDEVTMQIHRYPLFLDMKDKKAAVFGGGAVAARKIKFLLQCGAKVEAVSREFSKELLRAAKKNQKLRLHFLKKPPHPTPLPRRGRRKGEGASPGSFLKGAVLAFAASSDPECNRGMVRECRKKKIWVNAADDPEFCDFFVPSVLKRGKLQIAISTGGASPLLARKLREELARKIRPEAVKVLARLERLRPLAKKRISNQKERQKFFEKRLGRNFQFLTGRNGTKE